jgi:heptosyltransferase-2
MRLLVVKLADIGDVLTATPALRALRTGLPQAHITVLTTPRSVDALRGLPYCDDILSLDRFPYVRLWDAARPQALSAAWTFYRRLRAGRFDTIVFFHHITTRWGAVKHAALALASGASRRIGLDNGRGWYLTERVADRGFGDVHEVDYWLEVVALMGVPAAAGPMAMAIGDEERAWASDRAPKGAIAVHPGSGGFVVSRRWPPERFAMVADALIERYGLPVILVGGPDERDLAQAVSRAMKRPALDLAGQTTIKQLAAVLERCSLFVGGDSGVMHVAAAVGAPVVALFGPTNERAWGPYTPPGQRPSSIIVRAPGARPVMYVGHRLNKERAYEGEAAMAAITPEMVLAAARQLLG